MDKSLFVFLIGVIAVGVLLLIAISLSKKRGPSFNKEDYQVAFLKIENPIMKLSHLFHQWQIGISCRKNQGIIFHIFFRLKYDLLLLF